MAKTLVDIPQELIEQLDSIGKSKHLSRAYLIRSAISAWLDQQVQSVPASAFGILKNISVGDSVEWQRKMRDEWK